MTQKQKLTSKQSITLLPRAGNSNESFLSFPSYCKIVAMHTFDRMSSLGLK